MKEDQLLSMKAFSDFTGISQSTLRYYDKIGLFCPVLRKENNYRYYSPQQIITVKVIQVLSGLGVPLKQISEVEKARQPDTIQEILTGQESLLNAQIRHIRESYAIIHTFRRLIQAGCAANESEITDCFMEEQPIVMGQVNRFENNALFYEPFIRFCTQAPELRINLAYPIGGYFESMDAFLAEPAQPTRFFSLDPNGQHQKAGGRYLVGYTRGYYGEMNDLPGRLTAYAQTHKLRFNGPLYVIYLHDEVSIKDPDAYLAQVSVSVVPERPRAARMNGRV
ncbi:MAG: MerR family transcriptional regulator [Oscillospiraceae bacterium]|nr:MerR family transcriptional regulator [Oscillospiraceae bacterium]